MERVQELSERQSAILNRLQCLEERLLGIEKKFYANSKYRETSENREEDLKLRQLHILHALRWLQNRLQQRGIPIETNYSNEEQSETEKMVLRVCKEMGITSARMKRVPKDYYDWQLEQRREILNAPTVDHLCKSIILENTQCTNSDCSDPYNSRFYCVILQYTTKLQSHKVFKFVRSLKKNAPKKHYHFAYAQEQDSYRLSGFEHNAITPIGMKVNVPIILSHKIAQLNPPFFWMGGGEVDLKLGVDVNEFISVVKPFIADVIMD